MIKNAGQPGYRVRYRPGEVRSPRRGRRGRRLQEWFVGVTRTIYWVGLGILVVYAAYQSWHIFYKTSYFKVQEVEVTGARVLQKQEILNLTKIEPGTHFFRYHPDDIRANLLLHSRIRDVRVEQLSPRKISIQIREASPVVRTEIGGALFEVGEDGRLLQPVEGSNPAALPLFLGLPESPPETPGLRRIAPEFFAQIPAWLEALRTSLLADFDRIDFRNPYRIEVHWHGMLLYVGEPQDIPSMARHLKNFLDEAAKHQRTLQSIDLRFRMLVARYGSAAATPISSWTSADVAATATLPSTAATEPRTGDALTSHPAVLAAASTASSSAEVMTSESAMFNEAELRALEATEHSTGVPTAEAASSKPAFDSDAEAEESDEAPDPAYIYNPPANLRDEPAELERESLPVSRPRVARPLPEQGTVDGDQ